MYASHVYQPWYKLHPTGHISHPAPSRYTWSFPACSTLAMYVTLITPILLNIRSSSTYCTRTFQILLCVVVVAETNFLPLFGGLIASPINQVHTWVSAVAIIRANRARWGIYVAVIIAIFLFSVPSDNVQRGLQHWSLINIPRISTLL